MGGNFWYLCATQEAVLKAGDAIINAESLNIKNDDTSICKISGDLKYGTKKSCQIPEGVVQGKVSNVDYVNKNPNSLRFLNACLALLTLLVYVYGSDNK